MKENCQMAQEVVREIGGGAVSGGIAAPAPGALQAAPTRQEQDE